MLAWTIGLLASLTQPIPPPLPPAHDEGPGGGGGRPEAATSPRDERGPAARGEDEAASVAVEDGRAVPPAAHSAKERPGAGPAVDGGVAPREGAPGLEAPAGPEGLALAAVVEVGGAPVGGGARLARLAAHVRELASSPDPVAVGELQEAVAGGLPPGVLVAALVAMREHPNLLHLNLLRELAAYRSAEVRGQALASLAALGGAAAGEAVLAALDDVDPTIRRLGLHLARVHSDPVIEEAVLALRERAPEDFGFPEQVMVVDLDGEDEADLVVDVDLVLDLDDEEPAGSVAMSTAQPGAGMAAAPPSLPPDPAPAAGSGHAPGASP